METPAALGFMNIIFVTASDANRLERAFDLAGLASSWSWRQSEGANWIGAMVFRSWTERLYIGQRCCVHLGVNSENQLCGCKSERHNTCRARATDLLIPPRARETRIWSGAMRGRRLRSAL